MGTWKGSVIALCIAALGLTFSAMGQEKEKEKKKPEAKKQANVYTDAETAPIDYKIQGEYAKDSTGKGDAVQVFAAGNNKFDVYVLQGGLPGAGYVPKSKRIKIEAKLDADKGTASFKGNGYE